MVPKLRAHCLLQVSDILEYVQQKYPSCDKAIRFVAKNKTATGTVKLIFGDFNEVSDAVSKGIYIHKSCKKRNVETACLSKPRPLQSHKCWGYGHLASKSSSDAACRRCSKIPP